MFSALFCQPSRDADKIRLQHPKSESFSKTSASDNSRYNSYRRTVVSIDTVLLFWFDHVVHGFIDHAQWTCHHCRVRCWLCCKYGINHIEHIDIISNATRCFIWRYERIWGIYPDVATIGICGSICGTLWTSSNRWVFSSADRVAWSIISLLLCRCWSYHARLNRKYDGTASTSVDVARNSCIPSSSLVYSSIRRIGHFQRRKQCYFQGSIETTKISPRPSCPGSTFRCLPSSLETWVGTHL